MKLDADRRLMEQAVAHEREKRALMLAMSSSGGVAEEWAATEGDSNDAVFGVHRTRPPQVQTHTLGMGGGAGINSAATHATAHDDAKRRLRAPVRYHAAEAPTSAVAFNPASLERLVTPTVSSQNKFTKAGVNAAAAAAAAAGMLLPFMAHVPLHSILK